MLAVMVVCTTLLLALEYLLPSRPRAHHAMLPAAAVAAFGILFAIALRKAMGEMARVRIGASSAGFHFFAPARIGGTFASGGPLSWSDVYFDGRRLLAERTLIMAKSPFGFELFPRAALEREILSRIPAANFIPMLAFSFKATASSGPVMKFAYALLAVTVAVVLVIAAATIAGRP
jgi:hypothetical protein